MFEKKYLIVIGIILIILFAWAPWISGETAEEIVKSDFGKKWTGANDGCGTYNSETDRAEPTIESSEKTLFGYNVKISFLCGFIVKGQQPTQETRFVSFLGTVHK